MFWNSLIIIPCAFALAALLGLWLLPLLRRLNFGQTVRDDGPQTHLSKSGTPTMGAFMFLPGLLLAALPLLWRAPFGLAASVVLLVLGVAVIGFSDDYIKVKVDKAGLSALQKTLPTLLLCTIFVLYYLYFHAPGPRWIWPFGLGSLAVEGLWKLPYGLFLVIFMYFTINAVNLTDGVDGLLASVSQPVFLSLAWLLAARNDLAGGSLSGLPLALSGGLLGFLLFNRHPARVFMGDTGSLAVGGLFAVCVVLLDAPWLLFFSGVIYLAEALSVVIQVIYFKKTGGKRIFRMSPLHHHYELGGWSEYRIVCVFTLIALVASLLGLVGLAPLS